MSVPSHDELERALRAMGLRCSVEAWDALAVAIPEADERAFENPEVRRRAIALAREHGFAHLAVELRDAGNDAARAPLSRD